MNKSKIALTENKTGKSPITGRALMLGLMLIPLNAYWILVAELRWYMILTLNPLFVTPVLFLLVMTGINWILRRLQPQWCFTIPEMLTVYVMLVISCTVSTHDYVINLITTMGWGHWFGTPENKWDTLLLPYIPEWLVISDQVSLKAYYEGGASLLAPEHYMPWLLPLGVWISFMLVCFAVMICLNVLIRRAWIEETKLSFPTVRLPLAMIGFDTPGFFSNRLMWIGAIIPIVSGLLNGLAVLHPMIPHFQTRAQWPQFPSPPWNMLNAPYSFYPFAIGLGYFVPLDVLFSTWFFYLFVKAQIVVGYFLGITRIAGYPFPMEQGIGAWTTYAVLILYVTREHWKRLFSSLFNPTPLNDEEELLPYRLAFYGAAIGMIALIIFWMSVGMSIIPAVIAVGLYFLLALAITRVRAESGSQHNVWDLEPMNVFPLLGTRLLSRGDMIGAGLSHWFWRLNRSHPMPAQLEGLKMWNDAGLTPRQFLAPLLLATVAASIAGPWAALQVSFNSGVQAKCMGFANWTGWEEFNWMQTMLTFGRELEWPRLIAVVSAAGLTYLLWFMQMQHSWIWLHPLGYCAGPGLIWLWFPFMIVWFLKYYIVRFGGQKLYKRLIPLFLGLALGDYLIGGIWAIVSPAMNFQGYMIFH